MKKLLSISMLFLSITLFSQTLVNNAIELTGGYTPDGYGGNLNFNIILEENYVKLGVYMTHSVSKTKSYEIPYNVFAINGAYYMPLYKSNNERLMLSAGLGLSLGYEIINNGNNELPNGALISSESKFLFGGLGGMDLEFGVSPSLYLLTNVKEYYHFNSDLGNATMYAGFGIKYYMN